MRVADCLVTDPAVREIHDYLLDWRKDQTCECKLFGVVDAPSLSGKTQLAFTLAAMGMKVIHVVMDVMFVADNYKDIQPIYTVLRRNSEALRQAVENDVASITVHYHDPLSVSSLLQRRGTPWQTVLVIRRLLGLPIVDTKSYEVQSLASEVGAMNSEDIPVFIIDECFHQGSYWDQHHLRFLCNILRAAGLVCLLMSTNAVAGAMIYVRQRSRGSGEPSPWCTVFTVLPKLSEAIYETAGLSEAMTMLANLYIPDMETFRTFLCEAVQLSLPGMALMVVRVIERFSEQVRHEAGCYQLCELMDNIFALATRTLFAAKRGLREYEGLRGQLALQLSAYESPSLTLHASDKLQDSVPRIYANDMTPFIASHFANIVCGNRALWIYDNGLNANVFVNEDLSERWDPSPMFPSSTENPLLYLLVGGGDSRLGCDRPFRFRSQALSTAQAFLRIDQSSWKWAALDFSNTKASKRCNGKLEAASVVAMAVASRLDGLAGTTLLPYLRYLASELVHGISLEYHLLDWSIDNATQTALRDLGEDSHFGDLRIPFLSAADCEWPQSLVDIPTLHLGHLRRTKDNQPIDCMITVAKEEATASNTTTICVECKNYEKPMDKSTLAAILQRISKTANIHFVFLTNVQGSYFKTPSEAECASPTAQRMSPWEAWWQKQEGSLHRLPNVVKMCLSQDHTLQLVPLSAKTMPWRPWSACRLLVIVVVVESFFVEESAKVPPKVKEAATAVTESKRMEESTTLRKRRREVHEEEDDDEEQT